MSLRPRVIAYCLLVLLPAAFSSLAQDEDSLEPPAGGSGTIEAGMGIVNDRNFTFGRYNGWDEDDAKAVLDLDYRLWQPDNLLGGALDYVDIAASDLGLTAGNAQIAFGAAGNFGVELAYDRLQQVNNFTGRTPFSGGNSLVLPADWVASNTTAGMLAFDNVARRFDQELERERWSVALDKVIGRGLTLRSALRSEQKSGTDVLGGAIYIDASNGHAASLPRPVEQTTSTFDLGIALQRNGVSLDLSYLYSDFDNDETRLSWQNPYDAGFGSAVDYPAGVGQLALEPDNSMHRLRLLGSYRVSPKLHVKVDGSYAEASQDDSFLPYTVNTALTVTEGLPRRNLDGAVTTATYNASVYYRPLSKLSLEAKWRFEDRDNDSLRDGYRYLRGDGIGQPGSELTIYNTAHSRRVNRFETEGSYRLPLRSRLSLGYAYEETDRKNAAVRETEDDIYTLNLSTQPIDYLSARVQVEYSERAASTYQWAQSYFALFDAKLINQVPDTQRFNNHPLLFQHHLANRERWQGRASLSYAPDADWSVSLDYQVRENEYTESALGLLEDEHEHVSLNASLHPDGGINLSAYVSIDTYDNEQRGRAFRGGIEKNPFEIFAPLPQASDPTRDWLTESEDETLTLGVNLRWQIIEERLDAEIDLSLVESTGEQAFTTFGAPDLDATALPDIENEQQRLRISGTYKLKERLALKVDYEYHSYENENWALDGVDPRSIDRVLWTGETSANDDIHFFQASIIYRLE